MLNYQRLFHPPLGCFFWLQHQLHYYNGHYKKKRSLFSGWLVKRYLRWQSLKRSELLNPFPASRHPPLIPLPPVAMVNPWIDWLTRTKPSRHRASSWSNHPVTIWAVALWKGPIEAVSSRVIELVRKECILTSGERNIFVCKDIYLYTHIYIYTWFNVC